MTKNKMKLASIAAAVLSAAGLAVLIFRSVRHFAKGGACNA